MKPSILCYAPAEFLLDCYSPFPSPELLFLASSPYGQCRQRFPQQNPWALSRTSMKTFAGAAEIIRIAISPRDKRGLCTHRISGLWVHICCLPRLGSGLGWDHGAEPDLGVKTRFGGEGRWV